MSETESSPDENVKFQGVCAVKRMGDRLSGRIGGIESTHPVLHGDLRRLPDSISQIQGSRFCAGPVPFCQAQNDASPAHQQHPEGTNHSHPAALSARFSAFHNERNKEMISLSR